MSIAVIVVALLMMIAVGVFNGIETAVTNVSRAKADAMTDDDVPGADALVALLGDRERAVLATRLVSVPASAVGVGLVTADAAVRHGFGWAMVGVAVVVCVLLIFATAVPKVIALRRVERVAPRAARLLTSLLSIGLFRWVLAIVRWATRQIAGRHERPAAEIPSEEELVALADAAVEAAVLDDSEGEIIQSLVHFGDTLVREAMVPRPDVLAVSSETTIDEAIDALVDRGVSRMPVYGADIDDICGMVHIKHLFSYSRRGRGDHFVTIAQRMPVFVPEIKRAAELFKELKGAPHSMVIVVDEYGGTAGIVTVEDLIEEILGEIVDEFDLDEPTVETVRRGEWRVHGRMPVDDFNEQVGADLPDDGSDSIGGLIFDALGAIPSVGSRVSIGGYTFSVERVEGRRITHVVVAEQRPATRRERVR